MRNVEKRNLLTMSRSGLRARVCDTMRYKRDSTVIDRRCWHGTLVAEYTSQQHRALPHRAVQNSHVFTFL